MVSPKENGNDGLTLSQLTLVKDVVNNEIDTVEPGYPINKESTHPTCNSHSSWRWLQELKGQYEYMR